AIMLLVLLVGGLVHVTLHQVAPRIADTLTITVRSSPTITSQSSTRIFTQAFRTTSTIRQVEDIINRIPGQSSVHCPLGAFQPWYVYDFQFYWKGALVQDAHVDSAGCSIWTITTLGLTMSGPFDRTSGTWRALHQATGMPLEVGLTS
ncbi:MAG TPA: hypothetical protein VF916_10805, partial [Ktedonobacterales bacterium]